MSQILMHDGLVLPEVITINIINAAKRGLMTDSAKKLWLLPDTRYGPKDASGFQLMKPVKKKDALRLGGAFKQAELTRIQRSKRVSMRATA